MSDPAIDVSVVVVAYNEEALIADCLAKLVAALQPFALRFEVLAVENGSTDATRARIDAFLAALEPAPHVEVRVVALPANRYFSGGFQAGASQARGTWILSYSADMAFTTEDLHQYFAAAGLEPGGRDDPELGAVVGTRSQRPGYPLHLRLMSGAYNRVLRRLSGIALDDFNWNALYRAAALERVQARSTSIFFIPELLLRLDRAGYRLVPVPSPSIERTHGTPTVSRPRVWLAVLGDVLRYLTARR